MNFQCPDCNQLLEADTVYAGQVAEYLGVPYFENYCTGIFAPLANIATS